MEKRLSHNILNVLKNHNIRLSKRLGQNFLISEKAIEKLIESANITKNDVVLEIGPGIGNLTKELSRQAGKVIAIEKDPRMVDILKKELESCKNVEIIEGDALKFEGISFGDYKIVANLPFYITAPTIRKFLEIENPPKDIALIIQKEVAERICSLPPRSNILAASVWFYAEPKIISKVSRSSFVPAPNVDSSIIKITPRYSAPSRDKKFRELFFKIVKAGFSQPRKQLINNLSQGLKIDKQKTLEWLKSNDIRPEQRAETLGNEEWVRLAKSQCPITNKIQNKLNPTLGI